MIRIATEAEARAILEHPAVWPFVTDDGGRLHGWKPDPRSIMLGYEHDGIVVGLFVLTPVNCVTYDSHVAFLPNYRTNTVDIGKLAIEWAWRNTSARRIITMTPACNKRALRFVEMIGFARFGVSENSFMRDGEMFDLYFSGVSRG